MVQKMSGPILRALSSTILSYHTRIPVKELVCITIFCGHIAVISIVCVKYPNGTDLKFTPSRTVHISYNPI
jgi:hypothetical protein